MRFWDSSAVLPLVLQETTTPAMQALLAEDEDVIAWWGSRVEAHSALARLTGDGALDGRLYEAAVTRLTGFATSWHEVLPTDVVREQAERLVRTHPLRAGDALQLAAAVVASEYRPATLPLVTLDVRLRQAAFREGFAVMPQG